MENHQPNAAFPQAYGQYQPQQPQQQQHARQPSQNQGTPQQGRTAYAPGPYSYDQSSQVYGFQPVQLPQQQPGASAAPGSVASAPGAPGAPGSSQYPPVYQPQQYSNSSNMPYQQGPYVASGYQGQQGFNQPSGYGFPPYGAPTSDSSPYKPPTSLAPSSGSNINMAQIRGPLQSATQPPMIDPNQVPQRPKLTTTFWEDENTVCYQVEARGISVSRREDTNFINGTKLLNVAGMTRGRRDGILKSEKVRYVVKIGAMNLKGVWIPFERALELARNEGIVDLLYPLFVKDIKELYQGPQYSGGLTAAANSNPKNIIPVTVTNSSYTSALYVPKKDSKPAEPPTSGTPAASHDHSQQSQQPLPQPPQQTYQYGYNQPQYQYPQTEQYQYGQKGYFYQQGAAPDALHGEEHKGDQK